MSMQHPHERFADPTPQTAAWSAGVAGPPPPAAAPEPQGVAAWLQFIWAIVLPVIGHVAWIAGTLVVYVSRRDGGRIGAENARHAVNWCLTVCLTQLVLVGLAVMSIGTAVGWSDASATIDNPFVVTYLVLLLLAAAIGIAILVVGIMGAVRAGSGRIMRVGLAIPFIRAPKDR